MEAQDLLRELFRYHEWATLTLLDHAATLPDEQLHREHPGSVGSIYGAFAHILSSEGWSLRRYALHLELPPPARERTLEALRPMVRQHLAAWQTILETPGSLDFTMPAQDRLPEVEHAGAMLALQAIHHGELHRTDLRTMFAAIGSPVPGRDTTDVWAYWFAKAGKAFPE